MLSWILAIWIGTEAGCFLVYAWLTKIFGYTLDKKRTILYFIIGSLVLSIPLIFAFVSDSDPTVLKMFLIASCVSISFLIIYTLLFNGIMILYICSKIFSFCIKLRDKIKIKPTKVESGLEAQSYVEKVKNETNN